MVVDLYIELLRAAENALVHESRTLSDSLRRDVFAVHVDLDSFDLDSCKPPVGLRWESSRFQG